MLAHCKIVDVSVCASQAAASKAQPLWQQLGFQAKIYERKKMGPRLQKSRKRRKLGTLVLGSSAYKALGLVLWGQSLSVTINSWLVFLANLLRKVVKVKNYWLVKKWKQFMQCSKCKQCKLFIVRCFSMCFFFISWHSDFIFYKL